MEKKIRQIYLKRKRTWKKNEWRLEKFSSGTSIHPKHMKLPRLIYITQWKVSFGRERILKKCLKSSFDGDRGVNFIGSPPFFDIKNYTACPCWKIYSISHRLPSLNSFSQLNENLVTCLIIELFRHRSSTWNFLFLLPGPELKPLGEIPIAQPLDANNKAINKI